MSPAYARPVPNLVSDPKLLPGLRWAVTGLALAFLGGALLAQVGGGDSEFFFTLGFALASAAFLCLVVGGVALGTHLARAAEEPGPGEDATVR